MPLKKKVAVLLAATALSLPIFARADSLSDGFANPPNSARPRAGGRVQMPFDLDFGSTSSQR